MKAAAVRQQRQLGLQRKDELDGTRRLLLGSSQDGAARVTCATSSSVKRASAAHSAHAW